MAYASAGGKTYDAGVVARAKRAAKDRYGAAPQFNYIPTEEEKQEEDALEAQHE